MRRERGTTLIEVLVAVVVVSFALLALAHTFTSGYLNVVREGRETMALTAARQALEDCKSLPLSAVATLDGFDSDDATSLPTDAPARDIARRLRFAVAGSGNGFSFSESERAQWVRLLDDDGNPLRGRAGFVVAAESAALNRVTVGVQLEGHDRPITLSTLVTGL